jgi:N6-adenosine-specific RNA methylase IME4
MSGTVLLMADPPWKFGDSLAGNGRGAIKHYPCLSVSEIQRIPMPVLAPDCLLLLWRCAAMQQEALDVLTAWGFALKSEIVWVKLTRNRKSHFGMGRYVRAGHETCLIGARGRVEVADHSVRSTFEAPVQEHSRKPNQIYELAERLVPMNVGPHVELFARRRWPGWHSIGNQLPPREASP